MRCPVCGTTEYRGKRFCGDCGTSLMGTGTDAPAQRPTPPIGKRRLITVLFGDLVGFTERSRRLDAEDLAAELHHFHLICAEHTQRHGGHIAQFLGDGIVIYFGYPRASEQAPVHALRCALAIQDSLSVDPACAPSPLLLARFGAHTGRVLITAQQAGSHSEMLAIGEVPNIAARITDQAAAGTVVVSDQTWQLVQGFFAGTGLGRVPLKGLADPPPLWLVQRPLPPACATDDVRYATPFVGRTDELTQLRSAWSSVVTTGNARFITVIGEPGIGKSRLLREFSREMRDLPAAARMSAHCLESARANAFQPLFEPLMAMLGCNDTTVDRQRFANLQAGCDALELSDPLALPLLARWLSIPLPEATASEVVGTAGAVRLRTMAVLHEVVSRHVHRSGPCLLIVEDLHWADGSTLEWLSGLGEAIAGAPLLVLCASRPHQPVGMRWPLVSEELTLLPLSNPESLELARGVAQGIPLPVDFDRELLRQCEGVPLYLEEMTRAGLASGPIDGRDSSGVRLAQSSSTGMPLGVEGAIRARFERLGKARDTLHLAAVIGPSVPADLIVAASDLDPATTQDDLLTCARTGILDSSVANAGRQPLTFKHNLIWRAAYEEVPRQLRPGLHRRVVTALRASFPALIDAHPELIARQLAGAGELAEAMPFWLAAGQRAAAGAANDEAIILYETALEALRQLPQTDDHLLQELNARFALAPLYTSRYWAAPVIETTVDRILVLCERFPSRVAEIGAHLIRWGVQFSSGQVARSLVTAARAKALAAQADAAPFLAVGARHIESMSLFAKGRIVEALESADANLEANTAEIEDIITSHYQLSPLAASHVIKGCCLHAQGRFAQAEDAWRNAEGVIARLHSRPVSCAFAMGVMLTFRMVSGSLGDWIAKDRAGLLRMLDDLQQVCRQEGLRMWMSFAQLIRVGCDPDVDDDGSKAREAADCIRRLDETGTRLWLPQFSTLQAKLLHAAGCAESALAILDEARTESVRNGQALGDPEIHRLRARILAARGRNAEAERELVCAAEIAMAMGCLTASLRATVDLHDLLIHDARRSEGIALVRRALDRMPDRDAEQADIAAARARCIAPPT